MLAPVIEVTVIALNENLRGYPNAKDYFSAKLFLSAGLNGLVAWIAIFTLMPLVSGITVALLSPGAECFNTAFPNSLSNSGGHLPALLLLPIQLSGLGHSGRLHIWWELLWCLQVLTGWIDDVLDVYVLSVLKRGRMTQARL